MERHVASQYAGTNYYLRHAALWLDNTGVDLFVRCNTAPESFWTDSSRPRKVFMSENRVDDYALFLAASVRHFERIGFRIKYLELLNEPDGFWSTALAPSVYMKLVKAVRKQLDHYRLHDVQVSSPGTSLMHGTSTRVLEDDIWKMLPNTSSVLWNYIETARNDPISLPFLGSPERDALENDVMTEAYAMKGETPPFSVNNTKYILGLPNPYNTSQGPPYAPSLMYDSYMLDLLTLSRTFTAYVRAIAEDPEAWDAVSMFSTHAWDDKVLDLFNLRNFSVGNVGDLEGFRSHLELFQQSAVQGSRAAASSLKPIAISEFGLDRRMDMKHEAVQYGTTELWGQGGCYKTRNSDPPQELTFKTQEKDVLELWPVDDPYSTEIMPNTEGTLPEFGCQLFGHLLLFMNSNITLMGYWELTDYVFEQKVGKTTEMPNECSGLWGRKDQNKMFLAVTTLVLDTMPADAVVVSPDPQSSLANSSSSLTVATVISPDGHEMVIYVVNQDASAAHEALLELTDVDDLVPHKAFVYTGHPVVEEYREDDLSDTGTYEIHMDGSNAGRMSIRMGPLTCRAVVFKVSDEEHDAFHFWLAMQIAAAVLCIILLVQLYSNPHSRPEHAGLSGIALLQLVSTAHFTCYMLGGNSGNAWWDNVCVWGICEPPVILMLIAYRKWLLEDCATASDAGEESEELAALCMQEPCHPYVRLEASEEMQADLGLPRAHAMDDLLEVLLLYYPLHVVAAALSLVGITSAMLFPEQIAVVLFMAQTYAPQYAANTILPQAWLLGTVLLCAILYRPLRGLLIGSDSAWRWCIFCSCWLLSLLGPIAIFGYQTYLFDPSSSEDGAFWTYFGVLHVPSFIMGMALAMEYRANTIKAEMVNVMAMLAPVCVIPLFIMYCLEDPFYTNKTQGLMFLWVGHGAVLPFFMFCTLAITGTSNGRVSCFTKVLPPDLENLAMCLYIVAYPAYHLAPIIFNDSALPARLISITTFTLVGHALVVCPSRYHMQKLFRGLSEHEQSSDIRTPRGGAATAAAALLRAEALTRSWALRTYETLSGNNVWRLAGYYVLMIGIPAYFVMRLYYGASWYGILNAPGGTSSSTLVQIIKWFIMLCLPNSILNTIGQLLWPACVTRNVPSIEYMLGLRKDFKLYFRIVTRGNNPNLVRSNADEVAEVLSKCLPREMWEVEVATDNPLDLAARAKMPVIELLTPAEYQTSTGAKFKARALQCAIETSTARPQDWVIHLDEETKFGEDAVPHILHHCLTEHMLVESGVQKYGKIGQGGILYGTGEVENWITTLADSLRVADDYGKFRVQFECHECWVGMHGSFVVAQTAVEQATTFDHGMEGSITEDAYFALVARHLGVRYAWIDCHMYEQSPFSIMDFIKQRRRWFGGLYLVCIAQKVEFKLRVTLAIMTLAWALQPLAFLGMLVSWGVCSPVSDAWRLSCNIVAGLWYWCYLLGFIKTFDIKDGVVRYIILLATQLALLPLFAMMECIGVGYAVYDPPIDGFHVVQKETKAKSSNQKPQVQASSFMPYGSFEETAV
ncbi:hypothetical protein CYMTET_3660 [Cymbomonas tetramitiformis]|uniref:Glycosyltransferase 2-like domain-containing protein n=1 Tax=Cymbomonas tetramitiformis TaxID=36881 RepID=A0AAE0H311_9CHLO|nr:hypothetical protein CYMTET_3660 [Cymbomonas tetramitiformis]